MTAPSMQMVYCIPVEINDRVAAVACCDVRKVLSAGCITALPGGADSFLGITSDGHDAWLVASIVQGSPRPRRSNKARVLCLEGIPADTRLAIHVDRVQPITEAPIKSGSSRAFGTTAYTQTVIIDGAELPLLSSKAILSSLQQR